MAAQSNDWLDAMSTPVQNGKVLPDGSAVFNLPPNPADIAKEEREAAKEQRAQSEKTFRTMTAQEAAAQGLPAGGVYQINGLGEIKTIQEAPKSEKNAVSKETAAKNVARQLGDLRTIFDRSFAGAGPVQSLSEFLPSADRQKFQAIVRTMRADLKPLIRGPGEGTFTEGDQKLLDELLPDPDRFDAYNEQIFSEIENRIKGVLGEEYSAPTAAQPPVPAGSEVAPTYRIVTPEQSAEIFGEARFDPQGNPIGRDYVGETVLADGTPGPFMGRVTDTDPRAEMGFFESIGETITGSERETEETRNLPDWATMPELNSLGVDSFQAALGTMIANPAESVSIIRAQFPGVQVRQDEKGNFILRSSVDGQEYAIKPGFRVSDIPRAIGGIAAFTPAGRATTAGGAALSGGLTQTGIELSQAGTGGEFNAEEVLLASGGNVLGQQIGRGVNAVRNARAARTAAPETAPMQPAPPQAPAQPAAMADELVTPPLAPEVQAEVGAVARQAIGRGKSARDAQAKLAVMAQVDPEAKAAAERLGIELPVDVLSNDARLLTVTGLARSQIGSDAQATWGQAVSRAIQQSDDTLRAIGATRDLGQVSETIRSRLLRDIDTLEADANVLRREVDDAIDVQSRVDAQSLQAQLSQTIDDLGGIDEAKQAFSAEEKKLLAMLGDDMTKQPTYARLNQLRDQIGRALFKNQGPWVDAPTATLKRYYGALADDQINHIEAVAGKDIADKMRGSNDLYSQMFKARESMKTVFGKTLEKDIGPLIKTAITTGSKGNGEALRKLMAGVPEDLRPQAILSGIFSLSERQSAQGGFSFAEYAKLYSGLRQNSPIYSEIAKTVGPDSERVLRDLYSISKRVAAAENKIIRTGASNQPLINALNAEGLVGKVAGATARVGAKVAGAAAGGVTGGPAGAFVGQEIAGGIEAALTSGGKSNLDKLHGVLVSEPFKDLVDKVATGTVREADINRVANDKAWRRYAKTVLGIQTPAQRKAWLTSAISQSGNTSPEPMTTSTIEVR